VASDVAFDVLQKTYKTSELALIQYHLHIPGPDPMTNAQTEARAKFYGVNSTPSMLVNGDKKMVGGGAMAAGEKKYEAYCKEVDPLLEKPADCVITTVAKRAGNKIRIQTEVKGLQKPGENIKLRLVLVEESVKLVGANKLRFHHQVVRAMPGGVDGVALKEAAYSSKEEVDLSDLRKQLVSYLDDYAANKRAFPQPQRPMGMEQLRVIALVQDDATKEILQAVQVNVLE
jgi:hypothetical protein